LGQETFRATTNLVNVAFSVRDSNGALVRNLTQDDLQVFEDDVPQKISFFSRSLDVPLALGIVVDFSDSQQHFYKQHKQDLALFLKAILGPEDKAFLVCFGNHLRLVSDFSQSGSDLLSNLGDFDPKKGRYPELGPPEERILGTAFFDAIYYSVVEKLAKENGRRVLLVFSDGEDNSSAFDMMSTIEAAQNANVTIYSIRYTETSHGKLNARNQYGIRVMERVAKETGGAHFDARAMDPHEYLQEVADDMRASYELAYYPQRAMQDEAFRKIRVLPRQAGLTVRARTGYFPHQTRSQGTKEDDARDQPRRSLLSCGGPSH
jgi:Ca-activated chloride channel family protein